MGLNRLSETCYFDFFLSYYITFFVLHHTVSYYLILLVLFSHFLSYYFTPFRITSHCFCITSSFWYHFHTFYVLPHPFGIIFTLFVVLLHLFGIISTLLAILVLLHPFAITSYVTNCVNLTIIALLLTAANPELL
jgi:hypothetical protein